MTSIAKEPNLRILIVDDNPDIHKDFSKILNNNNQSKNSLEEFEKQIFDKDEQKNKLTVPEYHIDTASQGQEAVQYVEKALKEGNPYALAFVDIRMPPGWNGIETIKHIWQKDADVQIVICTAYSDYSWEETVSELGEKENLLILKKPFDSVSVRQLACALTKKWQLIQDARNFTSKLQQEVNNRTASLKESLSLVKATLESSNEGIVVINNEGQLVDYNQKFVTMWQMPRSILKTRSEEKLVKFMLEQLENSITFQEQLKELSTNVDAIKIDLLKLKDGRVFEYYSQPQKINNETIGRVFDFRDITKRIMLEKNLEYQATHDSLTGLANRVKLLDKIKQAIRIAEQNNNFFALLFLDLDRFKLINDSFSHTVGDEVLKIASNRLRAAIRAEDTIARLGGDEFIILFSNLTSEKDILIKMRNLQSVFNEPFLIYKRHITVNASIGISVYPKDGTTADILLRNADAAMYQAKEQSGNTFKYYSDQLNEKSLARLDQELQLRQALIKDEFFLCYQPQIDLKTNRIVASEALLRWQHPHKNVLLPIDFIQIAEETGLIIPIGEWVLRTACKQNKKWQEKGLPAIRIAINITAQQFLHQDMVALIKNVLEETKLAPEYLELELTENVIVSNSEIIKAVYQLKELGVIIAIDDFGTGYSSLSYLKKIPLDRLKIDSSFIQQIQSADDDEVIIRSVISIAKNLNLEVLAEGVETLSQLNFLKTHDCGNVQGFYFSKPLMASELEAYLKKFVCTKEMIVEKDS